MEEINGKSAILSHLDKFYKAQQGVLIEEVQEREGTLEDVVVYKSNLGQAHWLYVSLGLTELYDKESSVPDVSGFGIELVFRLKAHPKDTTPPVWVKHFLDNLAKYVFESGQNFDEYEFMDAGGVICQDVPTQLTAVAFVQDEQLRVIETPNGMVRFLQVIGLTAQEMAVFATDDYPMLLEQLWQRNSYFVTDLARKSMVK
jgi:suppressor of fused-like protein